MGVIVRTLSVSATSLKKWAERLGRTVLTAGGGVKHGLFNGYMARAVGDAKTVVVTVLDLPGQIIMQEPLNAADGTLYVVGDRDKYDSRSGATTAPYTRVDIPVASYATPSEPVGFDPANPAWVSAVGWPSHRYAVRYRDRLRASIPRISPVDPLFEYNITDQVPVDTSVFTTVSVYPKTGAAPSYALAESVVGTFAPGYQLLCRTDLGYMSFEYQGAAMATASSGSLTLCVIPVVKNFDPTQSVHWGHGGLLFVVLDSAAESPVVAGSLWTPDTHSSTFFHRGIWEAEPNGTVTSFRAQPQAAWDAFWSVPGASGGSRPNWTDGVDVGWFNGRFVVTARTCALNGVFAGDYFLCGGSAFMRFDVSTAGVVTTTEVSHEVWATAAGAQPWKTIYDEWVAGVLSATTLRMENPVGLITDRGRLIDLRVVVEGDRNAPQYQPGTLTGTIYPTANLSTAALEVRVTTVNEVGVEQPTILHTVSFSALGLGITTPTYLGGVMSPTASYKLWSAACQFVVLSENELAFLARPSWDIMFGSTLYPLSIVVVDLTTGAASVRGSTGVSVEPSVGFMRAPHLDCIQQTVYAEGGAVAIEGVLLLSYEKTNPVRISRDGGATWEDHITFPRPQTGAYYIGSPLMAGVPHSRAIA